MPNERKEYDSPVKLDGDEGTYFLLPVSIIQAIQLNNKRVTVFSFFAIRRGLDRRTLFTVNDIAKWMGRVPNRTPKGVNMKVTEVIRFLEKEGYLSLSGELSHAFSTEATWNPSKITDECTNQRFAVIYLDELKKILDYKSKNSFDKYCGNDVLLLVFAYLRMMICRRKNRLLPEEINVNNKNDVQLDISTRRQRSPDAYDCYYKDIAAALGISARSAAQAVLYLNELGLIYSEPLPRINTDDTWRTDHTIFCNAYKREGGYLLASGRDYYESEIKNKKKKLKCIRGKYEGGSSHD